MIKKLLFIIFMISLSGLVLYFSKPIITPFIMAFFLAYAINPLVEFLQKKGARRDFAILTVYLAFFLVAALVFGLIMPRIITDLTSALHKLPSIFGDLERLGGQFYQFYWKLPINLKQIIAQVIKRLEMLFRNALLQLAEAVVNLLSRTLLLILVPVLAYYINRDYPGLKERGYRWVAQNLGNHWTRTFLKIDAILKIYIRGQLLTTIIVGTLIGVGLSLLGLETAFLFGLVAGILNLIPYFGPFLGAVPAVLLALLHSPWLALYVVVLFIIVNQLEVIVLAPRIIGGSLKIHPLTVVYLILAGSKIGGILGMVFAVPLGEIILILVKSIYEISFGLENNEPISEKLNFNISELD